METPVARDVIFFPNAAKQKEKLISGGKKIFLKAPGRIARK